mgnify:CR=1 FL=1
MEFTYVCDKTAVEFVLVAPSPNVHKKLFAPEEVLEKVAATGEQPAGALTENNEIGFLNTVTVDVKESEQPEAVDAVRFIV